MALLSIIAVTAILFLSAVIAVIVVLVVARPTGSHESKGSGRAKTVVVILIAVFLIAPICLTLAWIFLVRDSYRTRHFAVHQRAANQHWPEGMPVISESTFRKRLASVDPSQFRSGGSAWLPEVEETLQAYTYASARSAARGLAREIASRRAEAMDMEAESIRIHLGGKNFRDVVDRDWILADMAEVFRKEIPNSKVVVYSVESHQLQARAGGDEVNILVDVPSVRMTTYSTWNDNRPQRSAQLRAHVRGNGQTMTADVRFIEKPWVERFDHFVSSHPHRGFIQARSAELATDQEEASKDALVAAAHLLARRLSVAPSVEVPTSKNLSARRNESPEYRSVIANLITDLNHGRFIRDRFSQRLQQRHGDVWREALLLEFAQDDVNRIHRQVAANIATTRRNRMSRAGSLLGLFVVICIGYFGLNALTKGYYPRTLVAACVAVFLLLGGVLLIFA